MCSQLQFIKVFLSWIIFVPPILILYGLLVTPMYSLTTLTWNSINVLWSNMSWFGLIKKKKFPRTYLVLKTVFMLSISPILFLWNNWNILHGYHTHRFVVIIVLFSFNVWISCGQRDPRISQDMHWLPTLSLLNPTIYGKFC